MKHDVENSTTATDVGFDDDGDDTGIGLGCVTAAADADAAAPIFPGVAVTLFFDGDGETMLGFLLVPDGAETF